MHNSIDLKTISYYFEIISYIIQSKYENDTLEAKILNIREAINNRQEAKEKIEEMVNDDSLDPFGESDITSTMMVNIWKYVLKSFLFIYFNLNLNDLYFFQLLCQI
jgi:hypothetical protein